MKKIVKNAIFIVILIVIAMSIFNISYAMLNTGNFSKLATIKNTTIFTKDNNVKYSNLQSYKIENKDYSCIISIEEIFKHNNRIDLNTQDYSKYVNGVKLDIENCKITEFDVTRRNVKEETQKNNLTDETYRIYLDNKFIGLGIVSGNKLKRDLIIQD